MIRFAASYLRVLICSGSLLLGLAVPAVAQMVQHPADERYELAQDLYEEGRLYQVIDTLAPYFAESSSRQSDILSLSAATYLFLDEGDKAKAQLLRLFNMNPFYQLDQSIPELRYLKEELVVFPKYTLQARGGVYIFNRPWIIGRNQTSGVEVLSEKYGLDPGDPIGTYAELTAGKALWPEGPYINAGLGFSRYSFRYRGVYNNVRNPQGDLDQATFSFREKHWWFHLPVTLKQHFLLPNKDFQQQIFIPYVFGGVSLELMRPATAEWADISLIYESMADEPANNFTDINIRELRNTFNFSLLAGGGLKARSGYHVGFIEIGYAQMFRNLRNNGSADSDLATQISNDFHYRGSDFTLSNLQITIGYTRFFYRAAAK